MQFLLAHAPYIHTCRTKTSNPNHKIDFWWPHKKPYLDVLYGLAMDLLDFCCWLVR
jgi:hypothetical protein